MTLHDYIHRHYKAVDEGCQLRLGQRFWNDYIKEEDSSDIRHLFYTTDPNMAMWIIETWLQDNHYFNELPPKLERE